MGDRMEQPAQVVHMTQYDRDQFFSCRKVYARRLREGEPVGNHTRNVIVMGDEILSDEGDRVLVEKKYG